MTSESLDGTLLVDFAGLAAGDPDFGKIFSAGDGYINFQDPKTVQQLTKSILKRHFKLKVELPDDRLCPPVPVRYEYIKWLQSLLDTTDPSYSTTQPTSRSITGIDIGTGSSAIYPLLGCSTRPSWNFIGTELDSKSFSYATQNVEANDLTSRIRVHKISSSTDPLIPLDALGLDKVDFTMCNPPFFTSATDMTATHLTKSRSPSAICSGAPVEMIYDGGDGGSGGDLGFVMRMLDESMVLRERVQWYTSMLGKLASATALVQALKERGVVNWAVTSLQAGNVTRRWVVGWSFGDRRARNDVARRNMKRRDKALLPFPTEFIIPFPPTAHRNVIITRVQKELSGLAVHWKYDAQTSSGLCFAAENVWSRSARRKRRKPDHAGTDPEESESSGKKVKMNKPDGASASARTSNSASSLIANATSQQDLTRQSDVDSKDRAQEAAKDNDEDDIRATAKLGVRITVEVECVRIDWLKGQDSVLWESFCGMLKRAIDTVAHGGGSGGDGGKERPGHI